MGKRMFECDIWDRKWHRRLSLDAKALIAYIKAKCDNAGFFQWDIDKAMFDTGLLEDRLVKAKDELKRPIRIKGEEDPLIMERQGILWLPWFTDEQDPRGLSANPKANAHVQIIRRIVQMLVLFPEAGRYLPASIARGLAKGRPTHARPTKERIGKEKDKEEEEDKEREGDLSAILAVLYTGDITFKQQKKVVDNFFDEIEGNHPDMLAEWMREYGLTEGEMKKALRNARQNAISRWPEKPTNMLAIINARCRILSEKKEEKGGSRKGGKNTSRYRKK